MDQNDIAVVSIVCSTVLGGAGVGASIYVARDARDEARRATTRELRSASYLEILRLVGAAGPLPRDDHGELEVVR